MKNNSQVPKTMTVGDMQRMGQVSQLQQHQSQHVDSALGTERLTSLHAKLHQEADKIRKWKVQTEMDMKHKEKKLTEATTMIESLRKSILELQLENENLSTKLQEELSKREEVLQRIQNTRELIGALKRQEEKLEAKLSNCETERTELKYLEKEHAQQFEEMMMKFKTLELDAKQEQDVLLSQVQEVEQKRQRLETEFQQRKIQAEDQIQCLSSKIDEKDLALREVHVMLQKSEDKLHATDQDLGASQQRVSSLSEELGARQQELDKFKAECSLLQGEKEQLSAELSEERVRADTARQQEESVQEALNNSVAIFNKRSDNLHKDIDILKAELTDEQRRLKEVRAQLTESMAFNESLKSSRDVLLLEKTEMELCLEKLKLELTELQSDKYKNKAEISSLEAEVESLQTSLQQEQQASSRLQVQVDEINPRYAALEKEKKHLQHELTKLKHTIDTRKSELEQTQQAHSEGSRQIQEMQQTIAHLNAQLEQKGVELGQLQTAVEEGRGQLAARDALVTTATTRVEDTAAQLHQTSAQLEQTISQLQDLTEEHNKAKSCISDLETRLTTIEQDKSSLETEIQSVVMERDKLQRDRDEQAEAAEKERASRTEDEDQLGEQLRQAKADLKAREKTVKELEKEVKTLTSRRTALERREEERSREVDYLHQEAKAAEDARLHSDNIIASLQTHLEQQTNNALQLEKQVDQVKGEAAQAEKARMEAAVQCERQIIEMTATLEKYTHDHQKLLALKDKEIDELRAHSTTLASALQQNEQTACDSRVDVQRLQDQVAAFAREKEQVEREKNAEIDLLKTQLSEKDEDRRMALTSITPVTPLTPVQHPPGDNPQRSILRQAGSSSKRRKVAFISPSVETSTPADMSDSGSSLDLELEEQTMGKSGGGGCRTPLRLRQSPHSKGRHGAAVPIVFTPNKRSKLSDAVRKARPAPPTAQAQTPEPTKIKEREFQKTPNMRKAAMRTSRFFRSSPKERTLLKRKEEDKERLSWFDDDAVYGFGTED